MNKISGDRVARFMWKDRDVLGETLEESIMDDTESRSLGISAPLRRITITRTHSRSKCMACEKQPVIAAHWANGHGMAWFCLKDFAEWVQEDDRDIVGVWVLKDGVCPKDIRKTPAGTVKIRKLGEQISGDEIFKRIGALIESIEGGGSAVREPELASRHGEHIGQEGREGEKGGSQPGFKHGEGAGGKGLPRPKAPTPQAGPTEKEPIGELADVSEVYPVKTEGEEVFSFNEDTDVTGQISGDERRRFLASLPEDTRLMSIEQRYDLAKVLMDMPREQLWSANLRLNEQMEIWFGSMNRNPEASDNWNRNLGLSASFTAAVGYISSVESARKLFEKGGDTDIALANTVLDNAEISFRSDLLQTHLWPEDESDRYWSNPDAYFEQRSYEVKVSGLLRRISIERGGPGSGFKGHAGRPGKVGGSASGKGGKAGVGELPTGVREPPPISEGGEVGELAKVVGDEELLFESEEQFQEVLDAADKHTDEAATIEPEITEAIEAIAELHGAEMAGMEFRLKSSDSLARKIRTDMIQKGMSTEDAAASITDAVRYTMLFEGDEYVEKVLAVQNDLQERGWSQYDSKWKNHFRSGDAYDGYNTVMVNEAGQRFELQFHTPESIEIKARIHPIYEEFRVLRSDQRQKRLSLWSAMTLEWESYDKPEGWERLQGVLK